MTETQRHNTHNTYWVLHGERVYLRPPTMHDARYVFHWERDDEVWRYVVGGTGRPGILGLGGVGDVYEPMAESRVLRRAS